MGLLEEIRESWAQDAPFDQINLHENIYRIPLLHQKYLDILMSVRSKHRKAFSDLQRMRKIRFRYFRGELTREELQEHNWDQWQGLKPLKNEMSELLDGDEVLLQLEDKLEYFKMCMDALEMILKDIHQRSFTLGTLVNWKKFEAGS